MKNKLSLADIFVHYSKPYRGRFLTLGIAMVFQAIIKIVLPIINGLVIDEIIYYQNLTVFSTLAKILGMIVIVSIIFEFIAALGFWFTQLRFALDIRIGIMKKIYSSHGDFLSKMKSGDVVQTVNGDTPQFMNVITDNIFETACSIVSCVLVFVYVYYINKKALIFMMLLIPLNVFLSCFWGYISRKLSTRLRDQEGNFVSWVFEIIKGIRDIQLLSGEKGVIKVFQKRYEYILQQKKKIMMAEVGLERANAMLTLLSEFAFYILGIYLIYQDKITIGAYITIISLLTVLNQNLARLCDFFVLLQTRRVSLERVQSYLNLSSETDTNNKIPETVVGEVLFENVTFSYGRNMVLEHLDLHIAAGKRVAVVGKNGVGKSTLAYLLLRFYDVSQGEIKIDQIPIQMFSLKKLRDIVGIVQQDILIFDDSLRNNITLGKLYPEEKIWEVCEKAAIKDIILSLPSGLDTVIGNNGFNLSGGQRQRIAIARIMLKNPPILILDEATASLDSESEQLVQKAWLSLSDRKTAIIIAHRLSSIIDTDYVAVLDEGRIIAFGHHKTLMESCPFYLEMFRTQYQSASSVGE